MKTIEITVYKFDELSELAKKKAIENFISNNDYLYIWDEVKNTVDVFLKYFPVDVETSNHNWLNYTGLLIDNIDEVLNFTPQRLRTYIINNFGNILYKPKFIGSLKSNNIFKHSRIKSKPCANGNVYNPYYSGCQLIERNCNLTGVCYDESILEPLYCFIDNPEYYTNYNLSDLFKECFETLKNDVDSEIESRQNFDYVAEQLIDNDYDFYESGEIY